MVYHALYRSGKSLQVAPLRAIHRIPFRICRESLRGLPLSPACRSGCTLAGIPTKHPRVHNVELKFPFLASLYLKFDVSIKYTFENTLSENEEIHGAVLVDALYEKEKRTFAEAQ